MNRRIIPTIVAAAILPLGCQRSSPGVLAFAAEDSPPAPALATADPVAKTEPPAPSTAEPVPSRVFAGDLGSRVLARILAPTEPRSIHECRTSPLPRTGWIALERPDVPTGAPLTVLISLPMSKQGSPRPRMLPALSPLADLVFDPPAPQRLELPPTFLISTPSRDANQPTELPVQAKFQLDRASLDDPTTEFSVHAALQTAPPLRDKPAPFVKLNLPEPFEHRAMVRELPGTPALVAPTPAVPK